MREVLFLSVLSLFLCCFQQSEGNSLKDPYKCGLPSCVPSTNFKYKEDIIYEYEYKTEVNTWFSGSTNNQSTLTVDCVFTIQFFTPCEGVLKFVSVSLRDQDESFPEEREQLFATAVSQNILRFAYHNCIITEICPETEEAEWVINFKRGILSLFQNSMKRFDVDFIGIETDIHGTCEAHYAVKGQDSTSLIITKTRDLNKCTERYKYTSILQTVRYNFQSEYQTWPVLKSESRCQISIDHNVYKSVHCKEKHAFIPFSGKNSGAVTTLDQIVFLAREYKASDVQMEEDSNPISWSEVKFRSNLLHHHTPVVKTTKSEIAPVVELLKTLCRLDESQRLYETPEIDVSASSNLDGGSTVSVWAELIRASRNLNYASLFVLLNHANTFCTNAPKYLTDALPYIATVGSVELIKAMILKNSATDYTKEEWLMSMAMIPRPQKEMLVSMKELLARSPTDQLIAFAASSMIHSYCRNSRKDLRECCAEKQNLEIIAILENNIKEVMERSSVNLTRSDMQKMTVSIKSLGNIGGYNSEFGDVLMQIIEDQYLSTSLRLTAIDAFRKTPCIQTREYFLHLFREDFVDIEVRLAAYLQVMKCPNLVTIRKIIHALNNEPVKQAASFVWSHLYNLGKSSIPSRVEIQGLLSGGTLPKYEKTPDFRTFSRNYENSLFFDQYNAGGNYEANVIFSPDSFIPRSLSLNLTIDLFGESINLLELKGRAEGFEEYFKQIFGEDGPLSRENVMDRLQLFREARTLNDADDIKRRIDGLKYEDKALNHRYPLADIGIKVFGNEMSYWYGEGDQEIRRGLSKLNPLYQINRILSGKEISYKKASLFLDTTYAVPTGCGFPLNMNLMGTSYINLRLKGSLKGAENFFTTKSLEFQGMIHPSIALNIQATMGVYVGGLSSTGIRVNLRAYTVTATEVKLKLRGTELVELDLSLPYVEQEIFAAKSDLIVLHGDKEHRQVGLNVNRIEQNTCSWSTFDQAIGLKFCAAYEFPNMTNIRNAPYFIMSGPSKYVVSLEKVDPSAKVYSLRYRWDQREDSNDISLTFHTPNSKEKRLFNASVISLNDSATVQMTFQSAEHGLSAHGTYKNTPSDKHIKCFLDIDGRKHFDLLLSLTRSPAKNGYIEYPKFHIVVNSEKIAELTGTLKTAEKQDVSQMDVQLEFQTKKLASRLIGYVTWNGRTTKGCKLKLDYLFLNEKRQSLLIEGVLSDVRSSGRFQMYTELGLQFSNYPQYNIYTQLKYFSSPNHIDTALNVSSTQELRETQPKLRFKLSTYKRTDSVKLDSHFQLFRPQFDVNLKYFQTGPEYTTSAVISYDPNSEDLSLSANLYVPPGTLLYVDGALNISIPTMHPFTSNLKIHEQNSNDYEVKLVYIWFTGIDVNIDAVYQDLSKTNIAWHKLKSVITSTQFKEISAEARYTQDNSQISVVVQGEYNADNYAAMMNYKAYSEANFTAYGQIDFKGQLYTLNVLADLYNNTNLIADMHLDQARDVHIIYQKWLSDDLNRLNAVINWDANRDPDQKLSFEARLKNRERFSYEGDMTIYYPGRRIHSEFDFLFRDWFCKWLVRLGWSPSDVLLWNVKLYSESHNQTIYALESDLDTPFQGWKNTGFDLMWRYQDNLQAVNGSMRWDRDFITVDLLADYLFKKNELFAEVRAIVNSTVATLPKAAAIAKHRHVWPVKSDTLLSFQYNNDGVLMINSTWQLDKSSQLRNVTGRVAIVSPFPGYKKCLLKTKFVFGNKRDVQGKTYLDLEEKAYVINVDGYLQKLTNCMLVVNVTSPVQEFLLMSARFGFVERQRHLVALVTTTNSSAGFEVLIRLNTLQDFDVLLHAAAPLKGFTLATLKAERGDDQINVRVAWDSIDLGIAGIWRYNSILDFTYLYKLYTPINGFEENGIVLKNLYGNGLDTEFSVKLSKHKFGISILMQDTGKGLLEVIQEKVNGNHVRDVFLQDFWTNTFITLDTLYYPTIKFSALTYKFVSVDEEDIIKAMATLDLPGGASVVLSNTLTMENYLCLRNYLTLTTPYENVKEVKSELIIDVEVGEVYNVSLSVLVNNSIQWIETSTKIYYKYEMGADSEFTSHIAAMSIVTPLSMLSKLNGIITLHREDAVTRGKAEFYMNMFTVKADGQLEMDDPYLSTSGSLSLSSPYLEEYLVRLQFKKDFTEIENLIECGVEVNQGPSYYNYFITELVWQPSFNLIRLKSRVALSPVLPASHMNLHYTHAPKENHRTIKSDVTVGDKYYDLDLNHKDMHATVLLKTPHRGFNNVNLDAEIQSNDVIKGTVSTDSVQYNIDGKIEKRQPIEATITLTPKGSGDRRTVRIRCDLEAPKYAVTLTLIGPVTFNVLAKIELTNTSNDMFFKIDSTNQKFKEIYMKSRLDFEPGHKGAFTLQAQTPFKNVEQIKADTDVVFAPKTGHVKINYDLTALTGNAAVEWSFLWSDMFFTALGNQNVADKKRSMYFNAFIGNSTATDLTVKRFAGFHMDVDNLWRIGSNGTFEHRKDERIQLNANAVLPKPNVDVHSINLMTESDIKIGRKFDVNYMTDVSQIVAGVDGNYKMQASDFDGRLTFTWGGYGNISRIDNKLMSYIYDNDSAITVDYHLSSPLHPNVETFNLNGTYKRDNVNKVHVLLGTCNSPGDNQIADVDLKYGGLRRTYGEFNISTPFKHIAWLKSRMDITNTDTKSRNQVDLYWPNKTTTLTTRHDVTSAGDDVTQSGVITFSIPLNRDHVVDVNYDLIQGKSLSRGNASVSFDSEKFVQGSFKTHFGKSHRNLDISTSDIEIENKHTPVGIQYIHEYDQNGSVDLKQATIFHLEDVTKFNVTGILDVKTSDTGKNVMFTAIQGTRTMRLSNNYVALDHDLYQGSRIEWAPNVWFDYNLHLANMTTADQERQRLTATILYPRRRFNLQGEYSLTEKSLSGLARMDWDVRGQNKSSEISGEWFEPEADVQKVNLALNHPSFRKNVTLDGMYTRTSDVMSNLSIKLQYSDFENEHLELTSYVKDFSDGPKRDYTFVLKAKHPATSLDLDINSNLNVESRWYSYHNYYRYQKNLFYEKMREARGLVDFNRNRVEYERNNETDVYKLDGTWDLNYPLFMTKFNVNRTTGTDKAVGALSINDKMVYGHYNSSDDVSYHLVGKINNVRSADLNAWRDFDDIKTSDIASYIRLNHSRLLTSSVNWRPEIFAQIRSQIVYIIRQAYSQFNDTLTILKEMPIESHDALKNVWNDATPRIRDFLDDLNDLHVIKDDLDEFQEFMNKSYDNNDFYIKDIVDISYSILDQMALTDQFENIPSLLKDILTMMGETSNSIKNSILWVIDTIKNSYTTFIESINKVLDSDLMEQVSILMEGAVLKYDGFIRDFHYKFVTYWDNTWTNVYSNLSSSWNTFLKSMEPTFIKFIHYLEQIVWKVGTETMDFFYQRTHEITESPYFNYLANLGQDFDHFCKDIHTNDAITNIKKYSKKAWDAIYANVIEKLPFRKELQEVFEEIVHGIKQLEELSVVKYIKEKFWEAKNRLSWWYEYFRIREAMIKIWDVIYAKVVEIPHTALQYEETHRKPKTYFVFDPHKGLISLEQKLPMSWHAFNRTPDFSEIPEYKVLHDFVNDWFLSNASFWSYYYEIKPYLDLDYILPPFPGLALMNGQGTIVTFDRQLYTISEPGTFLLAKDYNKNNFSILMESNNQGRYDFVLLTKKNVIKVDLYREQVTIGNRAPLTLPVTVDDYVLDRESDTFKIHSKKGIEIECNFLFKTCKFHVIGMYFGDIGGLFGTMNNEKYDDLQMTNNSFTASSITIGRSWNLEKNATYYAPIDNLDTQNDTLCEKFFKNKVSPLHSCFGTVDEIPFYQECIKGIDACSLANIFTELCGKEHIPVHMPEKCVQCFSPQGEVIEEGSFYNLPFTPNSTEVVFLIEAQFCNKNLRKTKNLDILIDSLESRLKLAGIKDNRYSIVLFGGSGINQDAKSLYVNNKFFTDSKEILRFFDQIYIEKADMTLHEDTEKADMFGALSFASNLPFRPGTSRTFLMFPCTRCDLLNSRLDYSVVHQVIMDTSATLHIIMNEDFVLTKKRIVKTLFGVDAEKAYTVKDVRGLVGDVELRKQVKLPKAKLGYCTSLAIESNGTVFAGKKLELERAAVRRFTTVLSERVAQSARPCPAQASKCECREAKLFCRPCPFRLRLTPDLADLWSSSEVDELIDGLFDFNLLNNY